MGTSKAAEGEGLGKLFGEAHHEGMVTSYHVQDFGSSSILALHEHYTDESKTNYIVQAGTADTFEVICKIKEVYKKNYFIPRKGIS